MTPSHKGRGKKVRACRARLLVIASLHHSVCLPPRWYIMSLSTFAIECEEPFQIVQAHNTHINTNQTIDNDDDDDDLHVFRLH